MRVSYAPHGFAVPQPAELTWEAFVARLVPHTFLPPCSKKDRVRKLPLVFVGEFVPGSPNKDESYVVSVGVAGFDYDGITLPELSRILELFSDYDSVCLTTWSNGTDAAGLYRVRVFLRLPRQIPTKDWRPAYARLSSYFGATGQDRSCSDPTRGFFGGYAPIGTQPFHVVFQGPPCDPDLLPQVAASAEYVSASQHNLTPESFAIFVRHLKQATKSLPKQELAKVGQAIIDGVRYAEPGHGNNVSYRLVAALARYYPDARPESLEPILARSLQQMQTPEPFLFEEIQKQFERALAKESHVIAEPEAEKKVRIAQSFARTEPTRTHPYTEPELKVFCESLRCTRDELRHRWILSAGSAAYLYSGGQYGQPYPHAAAATAVVCDLAPAPVQLYRVATNGMIVRKTIQDMIVDYGSTASQVVCDLNAQETTYDPTSKTITEACCPLRDLTPAFSPIFDDYLKVLIPEYQVHDVKTWLSQVMNHRITAAALFFQGDPGAGKGLFANGVSRLWSTQGATDYALALSPFNSAIAQCPLLFADEQMPRNRTEDFRRLSMGVDHSLRRKFMPDARIRGALRIFIAANNPDLLDIADSATSADLGAIEIRIYRVIVRAILARQFLEIIGPEGRRHLVEEDGIAKHCLWLRDNHTFVSAGRTLIAANDPSLVQDMTLKMRDNSAVLHWLCHYLRNPREVDSTRTLEIRILNGRLLVQAEAIQRHWGTCHGKVTPPTINQLSRSIGQLGKDRHTVRIKGRIMNYRVIDKANLIKWSVENGFLAAEDIESALNIDTQETRPGAPQPSMVLQ